MAVDMEKLNAFVGQFVGDLGAAVHTGMVVIGEKLGLYKALAERPLNSTELAAKTKTDERYVREFTKMLKETSAVVQKALDAHKTLEQMKQEKILEPWKKWSGEFVNTDAFIETLYNSLTGTKGEFLKHN